MHLRNPYRTPPDFSALADAYPPLRTHVLNTAAGPAIDFKKEEAQRRLSEALLSRDFGLHVTLLEDRLCPPIPNRLNYVLWIQDIMRATSLALPPSSSRIVVRGVDIGTGAAAIYPLLACALESSWTFIATDIDQTSLQHAHSILESNYLDNRIELLHVDSDGPILRPLLTPTTPPADDSPLFDFTMCNPPFYSSRADVARSALAKDFAPRAVCTGSEGEMITPGGEEAFVARMIRESMLTRERCRWYTSMLGKLASVPALVELLRANSIDNYALTEFVQGQTRRWALAWSFGDVRLPDSLARTANPSLQHAMPAHTTLRQPFPGVSPKTQTQRARLDETLRRVLDALDGVSVSVSETVVDAGPSAAGALPVLLVSAVANTWSRAARRRDKQVASQSAGAHASSLVTASRAPSPITARAQAPTPTPTAQLVCSIRWTTAGEEREGQAERVGEAGGGDALPALEYTWVRGRERALFAGFCAHVSRRVEAALAQQACAHSA